MYNVPIIVCGTVAERGLDEKRGATRATRDVIFLMCVGISIGTLGGVGMRTGTGAMKNCAAGFTSVSFTSEADNGEGTGCDAAIRIVHVGDCMGMLVCDEDIVWRSEEMWCRQCECFFLLFLIH